LDAASILAAGFNSNNTTTHASDNTTAADSAGRRKIASDSEPEDDDVDKEEEDNDDENEIDDDASFLRKCHEHNRKKGMRIELPSATTAASIPTLQHPPQQPPSSPTPESNANLAKQIASSLWKDGITGLNEEERTHVDKCDEGKNSKKCTDKQEKLEKRWFDTIAECGGHLSQLASVLKHNPHHL